jgi:hypothetical protein
LKHHAKWQKFLRDAAKPDEIMDECRTAMVRLLWDKPGYTYAEQQKLLIPWQQQRMKEPVV